MAKQTDAELIESFHLLFLQVLMVRGRDNYVLKGGANLRYFSESDRYSNDIDFDFVGRDNEGIERSVDAALEGRALALLSRRTGIEVVGCTKPKQTTTTRRWKLALQRIGTVEESVATKIEFSARPAHWSDVHVDRVPDHIVGRYGQIAPTLLHYGETAAIEEKIWALAERSETKARDVFDLDLLFRRRAAAGLRLESLSTAHAAKAVERTLDLTYESFRFEVLPFLDRDIAELHESEARWEQMREFVVDHLVSVGQPGASGR